MRATIGTSTLAFEDNDTFLNLETGAGLTPTGLTDHPQFFSGLVSRPEVCASGMLAVADVAASTYFDAAARTASRDPVVTASGDRLRFESFSACNGVHARFDLLADAVAGGTIEFGTTNVDINMALRTALAALPRHQIMHLAVGAEALRVSTPSATFEERKVELPRRWIRGFAEVPTLLSSMTFVGELPAAKAMAFVAGLPRGNPGPSVGVMSTANGARLTAVGAPGTATLAGTARLGSLRRLMRHVRGLSMWSHESGASAWVADLDGGRFTLVLTPQPFRGFSGEGQLLTSLVADSDSGPAIHLLEYLAWDPVIDINALAAELGWDGAHIRSSLGVLASSGKVGFDLTDHAFFHREIPVDAEAVDNGHPRLRAARKLVDSGCVQFEGDRFSVSGTDRRHWVRFDGLNGPECTCQWFVRFRGGRGPCSHILAAQVFSDR